MVIFCDISVQARRKLCLFGVRFMGCIGALVLSRALSRALQLSVEMTYMSVLPMVIFFRVYLSMLSVLYILSVWYLLFFIFNALVLVMVGCCCFFVEVWKMLYIFYYNMVICIKQANMLE